MLSDISMVIEVAEQPCHKSGAGYIQSNDVDEPHCRHFALLKRHCEDERSYDQG